MTDLQKQIKELKESKNAVILAHYYVPDEVQEIADYIGDSFYLSKVATKTEADIIVFAGVSFMGESAKLLNPSKKVLMPDIDADCPMAHMATKERIEEVRKEYGDVAVVCYINSTAELKCYSDVCVTSSNALNIVKKLPQKNIFFIPDQNLAHYIAQQVPEKNFIFNDGFCHVHHGLKENDVIAAKETYPNAEFIAHPECPENILSHASFIGSTSEIIDYATSSDTKEFIVGTEYGVFCELKKRNPDKQFHGVSVTQTCHNMKKNQLEGILKVLQNEDNEVFLDESTMTLAKKPLDTMLEMAQ